MTKLLIDSNFYMGIEIEIVDHYLKHITEIKLKCLTKFDAVKQQWI